MIGKKFNIPRRKGITRKQRHLREYDDEWQIIRAFDRIMKYGDRQAAIQFVEQYKLPE